MVKLSYKHAMRFLYKSTNENNRFNFRAMLSALDRLLFRGKSHKTIQRGSIYSAISTQINSWSCEKQDVPSFTATIGGYVKQGKPEQALKLYVQMQKEGTLSDQQELVLPCVLKACVKLLALQRGKEIHGYVIRSGFESDFRVTNALIYMYTKCRSLEGARELFDKMSQREVISWSAMILGYSQNGYCDESLDVLQQMQIAGVKLDLISWTAMISGFVHNGREDEALKLFYRMQLAGVRPNSVTVSSILPACYHIGSLQKGRQIHSFLIRIGIERDVFVGSTLVDMYSKCHSLEDARKCFDNMPERSVVSWNAMITGYVQAGSSDLALKLFDQMQLSSLKPNSITIASVLPACANAVGLKHGKEIHQYSIKNDVEINVFVQTALVHMYAKCGSIEVARRVFDKMFQTNVVTWNAMIAGYAQNGHGNEALKLFHKMQLAGMKPNSTTMASILPACADMAALQQGREIHNYIIRSGYSSNSFVGSALIDMYAKCGGMNDARCVFDKMSVRSVGSWNAMVTAYALHGRGEDSLDTFNQMQETGLIPDHITFTGVLSACTHAGMVCEGMQFFDCMSRVYDIVPRAEHYACVVDLLARAGYLEEAYDIVNNMPFEPTASILGALLASCRTHSNVEIGELMAEHLFKLEPENSGNYILLSSIYSATCRWDDEARIRKMMRDRGIKKKPGCSWIEIDNSMHTFAVGNKSHPQMGEISVTLKSLAEQMKEAGYVPERNFAHHDVEEEEKDQVLCGHSEKLAISFGLINTFPGTPLRIIKNLRVCGDCHTATKYISKIVGREIVVRDSKRFHHYKDGQCSCGDYW